MTLWADLIYISNFTRLPPFDPMKYQKHDKLQSVW
jgi:hypothetical protein